MKSDQGSYYGRYVVDHVLGTVNQSSVLKKDIVGIIRGTSIRSSNEVLFTLKDGGGCIDLSIYESDDPLTINLASPSLIESFYPSSDLCNDQVLCFLDWLDQRLEEAKS